MPDKTINFHKNIIPYIMMLYILHIQFRYILIFPIVLDTHQEPKLNNIQFFL